MDILAVLNFALSVVIGLVILVILVVIHELGHGIVARRNGVVVEEFGIGFPPFAWGKKIAKSILGKNVLYSLNWLPLGGFVKLQGEHDAAKGKGDYGAASFWVKTKILLAGVVMNWVIAALLLTILAATSGLPKMIPDQFYVSSDANITRSVAKVDSLAKGLPAQGVLQPGDEINRVSVEAECSAGSAEPCRGETADDVAGIVSLTKNNPGKNMIVDYSRDGKAEVAIIQNRTNEQAQDGKGYMGVKFSSAQPTMIRSTWSAPIVGVALTGQFTQVTLSGLGDMLVKFVGGLFGSVSLDSGVRQQASEQIGEVGNSVGGPIALLGMLFPSAREAGLSSLVLTTALVSLTLAVMNILPIPGLDGGRWFVTFLYRKVLRKPLTKDKEEQIYGIGMLILFGLIILVTIADVFKLV